MSSSVMEVGMTEQQTGEANLPIMAERKKRKRVDLTVAQKQEICRFYEKNPNMTIKDVQDYFSAQFGLCIGHSTIGTTLKRAEHWNSVEFPENVKRTSSPKFAGMEADVFEWICKSEIPVSENDILLKAAEFVKERALVHEWNTKIGWITSFKRRFNLVLVPIDEDELEKGYRPGKMPVKSDPIRRVFPHKGRKPGIVSKVNRFFTEVDASPGTYASSSIIYDAAVENILQDVDDDDNVDDDTVTFTVTPDDSPVAHHRSKRKSNASSPVTKRETRARSRTASRQPNANADTSIIHVAAIENVVTHNTQQQGNNNAVSSTDTNVIPVVIQAGQSSVSVTLPSAQSAMTTLMSFFEQNATSSQEDMRHLQAIDAKLKWLSAKEAVSTLKTYMSSNPTRNPGDVQYLDNLDQRL